MIAKRHRAMAVATLLLACSAARAGERDRFGTVRTCWAGIRALPDPKSALRDDDPNSQAYLNIVTSHFCSLGAVVLARAMLLEHPELQH